MRVFSNFNTKFIGQVLKDKQDQYEDSEIFTIQRSKYFLIFYVLFHCIGYLTIILLSFLVFAGFESPWYVYLLFGLVWGIIFWFRIVHKILKYICDFTVVTPGGITTYKQRGILHSVLKEIPARRIKAVEISRESFLGNVFGYGSVDIIADMNDSNYFGPDEEAPWVVGLTYVDKPHIVKEKISKICFK